MTLNVILIICIVLLFISAISKALIDDIQFHYDNSIFSKLKKQNWWNPKISWRNKYKKGIPSLGPKFIGSTTFLVFVTDAWHFFQSIMLTSTQLTIIIPLSYIIFNHYHLDQDYIYLSWIILVMIYKMLFGMIFELFYGKIFIK